MALATLTTKGQVTIPKEVRESLKLHTGNKIEIFVTDAGEAIIRPVLKTVDEVFSKLHCKNQKVMSVDSMNNAIKDRMRARFK